MKVEAKITTKTVKVKVSFKGNKKKDKVWKVPVNHDIQNVSEAQIKEEHGAKVTYTIQSNSEEGASTKKGKKAAKFKQTFEISYDGKDKNSRVSGYYTITYGPWQTTPTRSGPGQGGAVETPNTEYSVSPDDRTVRTRPAGDKSLGFNLNSKPKAQTLDHPHISDEEDEDVKPHDDDDDFDESDDNQNVNDAEDYKVLIDGVRKEREVKVKITKHLLPLTAAFILLYTVASVYVMSAKYGEFPVQSVVDQDLEPLPVAVNFWGQFLNAIAVEILGR